MSVQDSEVDDCRLLKLLEAGLGETEAARQLNVPSKVIQTRIRAYLEGGILHSNGERDKVDWRAYGRWARSHTSSEAA